MKYIDAEKLIAEIEKLKSVLADPLCNQGNILGPDWVAGGNKMLNEISSVIASLQQDQPEYIVVPRWCLEGIENALRIQNNINLEKEMGETCQDRNIKCSLNQLRKLLVGEELTGMERLEPLKEQPEVDIITEYDKQFGSDPVYGKLVNRNAGIAIARHFYELRLKQERNE